MFTEKDVLSVPTRSPAVPNHSGTLAIFTSSSYSFESHTRSTAIKVLNIKTGDETSLSTDENVTEPQWLGHGNLIVAIKIDKSATSLIVLDADEANKDAYVAAEFSGSVSNLKISPLDDGTIAFVVTGLATPSGSLYNPENEEQSHSSGKVYNSLFVRHWAAYETENKSTIWYGSLKSSGDKYRMPEPGLVNALKGQKLSTPVPPFGGLQDFDISKSGIIFIAKDPDLNESVHTKSDLYYIPLKSFSSTQPPPPQIIEPAGFKGYAGSPTFSPDANKIAFTKMKEDGNEVDLACIFVVTDLKDPQNVEQLLGDGSWEYNTESITWTRDGKHLLLLANAGARKRLYRLPSSPTIANSQPAAITEAGSVVDVQILSDDGRLLISSSSFLDSSLLTIVDPENPSQASTLSTLSAYTSDCNISRTQIGEFTFKSSASQDIHSWLFRPSSFAKTRKYPLLYLVHGGPQYHWSDAWDITWNPLVFAEAGYVVVMPNITGSCGFGKSFMDAISCDWGGQAYEDLVSGFEYVKQHMPYIDTTRSIAAGVSWGGYMINWIQGHELGRSFSALVTDCGMFSIPELYGTDELFYPHREFGGTLWENRAGYERFDPARFVHAWKTPHMIVHNEMDYRVPIGHGLSAFNVLQAKGVESRFLTFNDEGHGIGNPENQLFWYREVLRWCNKYAGIADSAVN